MVINGHLFLLGAVKVAIGQDLGLWVEVEEEALHFVKPRRYPDWARVSKKNFYGSLWFLPQI